MTLNKTSRQSGFTFIELVVTVAIVALLASVVLPMAELTVKRDQEHELRSALREIRTAVDAYKQAVDEGRVSNTLGKSGYPPRLKILVEGIIDEKNPEHSSKIYFLRRIPRDPMYPDANKADEDTWGKRSYESSRDSPAEGDDVFDVYSLSNGVGLNGVPYKDW